MVDVNGVNKATGRRRMIERVLCPFAKEAIESKRESRCAGCQLLQNAKQVVGAGEPLCPAHGWRTDWRHVFGDMHTDVVNKALPINVRISSDSFDPGSPALLWRYHGGVMSSGWTRNSGPLNLVRQTYRRT